MYYGESEIYKRGKFYEQLGLLMQNPNSTLDEIVEFAFLHGLNIQISISNSKESE